MEMKRQRNEDEECDSKGEEGKGKFREVGDHEEQDDSCRGKIKGVGRSENKRYADEECRERQELVKRDHREIQRGKDERCTETERECLEDAVVFIHLPALSGFPLYLCCRTTSSYTRTHSHTQQTRLYLLFSLSTSFTAFHFPAWENSCAAAAAILNYIGQWEIVYMLLFCDRFMVRALHSSSKRGEGKMLVSAQVALLKL